MKLITVCFTFSTALPILNVFILGGLFLTFWIHKYILIKYAGKVPPYSNHIIQSIFRILKIAIILHVSFAIYFLSNEEIFPTGIELDINTDDIEHEFLSELFMRLWRVFPLVLFWAFIIAVYFFHVFFAHLVFGLLKYFKTKRIYRENIDIDTYKSNLHKIKLSHLENYQMMKNPEYKRLLQFSKDDLKEIRSFIKNSSVNELIEMTSFEVKAQENKLAEKNDFEVDVLKQPLKK